MRRRPTRRRPPRRPHRPRRRPSSTLDLFDLVDLVESSTSSTLVFDHLFDRRLAPRHPALLDLGRLPVTLAQVVQLGPADVAQRRHLDLGDGRRVHRERPLDADAEAHLAHGEGLLHPAALAPHDRALEDLHPLPVALDHPDVDLDGVAGRNSGMSSRRLSRSIVSVGCMGGVLRSHRLSAGRNIVAVLSQGPHVAGAAAPTP